MCYCKFWKKSVSFSPKNGFWLNCPVSMPCLVLSCAHYFFLSRSISAAIKTGEVREGHQFISNDWDQCRGKVPCLVKSCTLFVLKINSWQQGGDLGVLPRCWLIFALVQLDITSHQPSLFPPFVLKGESGPFCTWPCYGEFYLHIFIVCLQVERIIRWTISSEAKSWIWWLIDAGGCWVW